MIQIDLGQDQVFEVTVNGQTYELREPTVVEIDKLNDADSKAQTKAIHQLFVDIGLPQDVVEKLSMSKAKRLIEGITSELTKKK